jgi:hypothetical protein
MGTLFLFLLFFWLCASMMSGFVREILLLQRLDVISIFLLILIYSLY